MICSSSKTQKKYHLADYIHSRGFVLKRISKKGVFDDNCTQIRQWRNLSSVLQ